MEANLEKIIHMRIKRTMENLEKNGMKALYAPDRESALALLKTMLVPGQTIGVGGSVTLSQIGALELIRDPKYHFFDRYDQSLSEQELDEVKKNAITADVFLASTNALTETGMLYNIDGTGNRLCAFVYGPGKLIIVAGYNKIVPTIEDAIVRVKTICAPANAVRLGLDTYCAKHGHCINAGPDRNNLMFPATGTCDSRMCNNAVITGRQRPGRTTVIIVGEVLGY